MADFTMPSLGAEMTEGKLVEWLVHPGDAVKRGDIIAVVETDKAALDVEVWQDGVVEELLVPEGQKVPVGTVLARLGEVGAVVAAPPPAPAPVAVPIPTPAPTTVTSPVAVGAGAGNGHAPQVQGPIARHRAAELGVDLRQVQGTGPGGSITRHDVEEAGRLPRRPRVSPFARRLAQERGVDLGVLSGSGPGGAIVAADVPTGPLHPDVQPGMTASAPPPADAMRTAIARAMARSKREIPHYYLGTQVDVTGTSAWLDGRNADRPPTDRVLLAALQLKAVALALRDHPALNGFWIDDAFRPGDAIDLGVAIALRGGGLVAPAIHATDTLDLDALMAALRDLVRRSRSGRMRASEATSATLTVTNLGDLGVETVYGVIYPPQVALVGFGRPVERPWVVDGAVAVRTVVDVTLAADHRQTDGHLGARFLARVGELLRTPEEL